MLCCFAAIAAAFCDHHMLPPHCRLNTTVPTNSTTSDQVARMRKYAGGQLPCVRFGSTETCLQVMGTPLTLSVDQRMIAFQRGWSNKINDVDQPGYYIGGLPWGTILYRHALPRRI
jgi:hypothetical protein